MTPQEQQLLMALAERVNQTKLQEKDPDAENLLGRELGANPDAVYILAQTVLVQNIALEQARAQVAQLQQQAQQSRPQPAHTTSFLGRLLGDRDQAPPPPSQQQPGYQQVPPQYTQAAPPAQYQAYPQYQQAAPIPTGQPSFLRGAMQTAAGVAAGALAFEGVESVLHGLGGFGHPSMGMGGMSGFGMAPGMGFGGGFDRPVEETVVNNYYDDSGGGERRFDGDRDDNPHLHESDYRSDDRGGGNFSDASYNTSGQDNYDPSLDNASAADDNSLDNVGIDDSSSFDDGGYDNSGDSL